MPYKNQQPIPSINPAVEDETIGLDGGFVGEMPPKQAARNRSPSMNAVRFIGTSVRKDFGYTHMGEAAPYRILGLIEHKFIRFQSTFLRLARLMRDVEERLRLEVWDGLEWVFVGTTDEQIDEVYISHISIQGVLLMAEGNYIFIWEETFDPVDVEQGWPEGNLLTDLGDFTTLIVDPNEALGGNYTVNLTVLIRGASLNGITVRVGVVHNGVVIATKDFFAPATENEATEVTVTSNISFVHPEIIKFDLLHLRLISIDYEPIPEGELTRSIEFFPSAPVAAIDYGEAAIFVSEGRVIQMSLSEAIMPDENPANNTWTVKGGLRFSDVSIGRARTRLLLYRDALAAWEILDEQMYEVSGTFPDVQTIIDDFEFVWVNPGADIQPLDIFRIEGSWEPTGPPSDPIQSPGFVGPLPPLSATRLPKPVLEWELFTYGLDAVGAEVHGHEEYEEPAGLTYQTEGGPVSVLEVVSPDAPGGRYIFEFADRVVSLRDGGDTQVLAWSASGNVREWFPAVGAGRLFLVSSQDDPIDDLMAGTKIGSNIAIVIRKRSIMRLFPTGNIAQALGVVSWINGIGTESPFSLQNVERGAIFLGHNLMVYFINEQGLQAIGTPIHQELIRVLTSNLELVDAAWDPVFNEYILGIPEENSLIITKLWYFDVRRFLDNQEFVWRSREVEVQRLATSGSI